jgi:transposase-like protein
LGNYTDKTTANPAPGDFSSALEQILHKGAQDMLQLAVEIEVQQYIEKHQKELDENGHRMVVRNGYLPEKKLFTGIGPVKVKQPRIDDRKLRKKSEGTEGFSSRILSRYMRRIPSIDNLIPALYLKGISTNDFPQALSAILGKEADGLSATTVVRLKSQWEEQYREWSKRDLKR